jgi:hypothetical protein
MRAKTLMLAVALLSAGCMISEQDGQLIPDGNLRYWNQQLGDVRFHFDSTFNKVVLYGRSAALVVVALWVFAAERGGKPLFSLVLGPPLLAAASFLVYRDLPTLREYEIAARAGGLTLAIPPAPRREMTWDEIETMSVKGVELRRSQEPPGGKNPFVDLPEWESMELRTTSGETFTVDLTRLSQEQRQSVWKAIVVRARLQQL